MSQSFLTGIPVTAIARDSTYVDAYVNQIRLSANIGDVALVFGVIDDIGPGQAISKDKATIRMSMPTAKALLLNLQALISGYENAVGQIPLSGGSLELTSHMSRQVEAALKHQLTGQPPKDEGPGAT